MNFPASLKSLWRGKRFNSFNRVLYDLFRSRVYKVGLRLDFTCPNRDGTVAVGGCIYCNNASHTARDYRPKSTVAKQLEQGILALGKRHKAEKFIAYFQSYTNTYEATTKLEKLYREALNYPGIVGIAIATRPDCLPDETLDLLADLSQETYLWLEVGLESMDDRTLRWINRGHSLKDFLVAVEGVKKRKLRVCAHLILGFPGETHESILATAGLFNDLGIDGIKLHNLHVIKNTVLERLYQLGQVPLMSRDEYLELVIDFLESLNPAMIVHRLYGATYRTMTVAPAWSVDKRGTHNALQKALEARDAWQGKRFAAVNEDNAMSTALDHRQGAFL